MIRILSFLFPVILFVSACQKEIDIDLGNGGSSNNSIVGDYFFAGLSANTQSTMEVNDNGTNLKSVTVAGYHTKNNTGTFTFTASQMTIMNMSYTIDTTLNLKLYVNGVLIDDSDFPFIFSQPAYSATFPYTRNGIDSITVTGPISISANPSGVTPAGPSGFKIAWAGDTLLLKMNNSFAQNINQGGMPASLTGSVNGVIKLKKQ